MDDSNCSITAASTTADSDSDAEDSSPIHKRAKHNSKSGGIAKTTQFGYYPGNWQEVLDNGKNLSPVSVATKARFPSHTEGIKEADGCLDEAMVAFADGGICVETGKYLILCSYFMLIMLFEVISRSTNMQ